MKTIVFLILFMCSSACFALTISDLDRIKEMQSKESNAQMQNRIMWLIEHEHILKHQTYLGWLLCFNHEQEPYMFNKMLKIIKEKMI